jgi:YVTN family beta-propeller protein
VKELVMAYAGRSRWVVAALLIASANSAGSQLRAAEGTLPARVRRPSALVVGPDGRSLFVANKRSGSISILDVDRARPVSEIPVGRRIADLVVIAHGQRLLTVDEEAAELIELDCRGPVAKVLHRIPVSAAPVSVRVGADGSWCSVACLWSRQVHVVDLGTTPIMPRLARTVTLPFAPRLQVIVQNKVIVADSFGGRLALVEASSGKLLSVRALPAHNVRGLALSTDGKSLLLAHQVLDPQAHTTRDDIHWGNLIANKLRVLALARVLEPQGDLLRGSALYDLGDVGQGSGDPSGLACLADGMLICLAGTGEVLFNATAQSQSTRLRVGAGPTAVALSPDQRRAYVANAFADSVSVLNLATSKVDAEIPLGPSVTPSAAERGEALFHDARLSRGGWFSCHSCHTDGHSNGLRADTLGDGSYGSPKRVPSLLGVRDTGPWAWNGSMATLRDQVRKSLQTTMRGPPLNEHQLTDLEAYLRTLPPPPPRAGHVDGPAEAGVRRGQALFTARGCVRCHQPPHYTTPKTYDVGLVDEAGNRLFNPPSLRGVTQGGPYFHDGRAATLDDVLTRFQHGLERGLGKDELQDLLAFLRTL